jgi:hypothetical protein
MPESFKACLESFATTPYPGAENRALPRLTSADRAHLKRWAEHDEGLDEHGEGVEEMWQVIESAVHKRGMRLPAHFFIGEMLGTRRLAISISKRRKERHRYRKLAAQMEALAKLFGAPLSVDAPLIPFGAELARKLDHAARIYREHVAVSRTVPGQVRWTHKSKPRDIFISLVSHFLRNLTGGWLDRQVTVLTQIAFDDRDLDNREVVWIRRQVERRARS